MVQPPARMWSPGTAIDQVPGGMAPSSKRPPAELPADWSVPDSFLETGSCGPRGSSVATLVAHIGALRSGLVVVPANTAYTAREIAHIVTDVRPAAAIVDDPRRGQWASEAASGPFTVFGPELDGPDGDPGPLDVVAPRGPRAHWVHLWHHGCAQGRGAQPQEPAGQRGVGADGLALDTR